MYGRAREEGPPDEKVLRAKAGYVQGAVDGKSVSASDWLCWCACCCRMKAPRHQEAFTTKPGSVQQAFRKKVSRHQIGFASARAAAA